MSGDHAASFSCAALFQVAAWCCIVRQGRGNARESVFAIRPESTPLNGALYINTVIHENFFVAKSCDSESENRALHDASQRCALVSHSESIDHAMKEMPAIKGQLEISTALRAASQR